MNEILGDHNVDKQITDNKDEVAYLMADISDVSTSEIKEISEALEALSCKKFLSSYLHGFETDIFTARILTRILY